MHDVKLHIRRECWVVELGEPWQAWTFHYDEPDAAKNLPPPGIGTKWRITKYAPLVENLNEYIVGVAIRFDDGRIFSLPRPYRHNNVIHMAASLGEQTPIYGEQGFITESGKFLDRKEAGLLAEKNGQAMRTEGSYPGGDLYSEDLW